MGRMLIAVGAVLLCAATLSHAETFRVNWNGTADYESIGEAVGAARDGDTVLVAPGTYTGENNRGMYVQFDMTIMSEGGRRSVTIDAGGQQNVFWFSDWTTSPVLSGFTIQNGDATKGGGIYVDECSPIISDCDIVACTASSQGGGLYCGGGAAPTLTDVSFTSCWADLGAGVCAMGATPSLTRVRFGGNVAVSRGGGAYIESAPATVEVTDCEFYNNSVVEMGTGGGGLWLFGCTGNVTGTTFAFNRGNLGTAIRLSNSAAATLENCILSFGRIGTAIWWQEATCSLTSSRCIVYGNEFSDDLVGSVSDTLNRDPRFCGMMSGDLTLCSNSWCLPGGNVWGVQMGAYGDGACGECETPLEGVSWGVIKGMWR